jgi:hypothetical protein
MPLRAWMACDTKLPCVWCPRPVLNSIVQGICARDVEGAGKAPHGTVTRSANSTTFDRLQYELLSPSVAYPASAGLGGKQHLATVWEKDLFVTVRIGGSTESG